MATNNAQIQTEIITLSPRPSLPPSPLPAAAGCGCAASPRAGPARGRPASLPLRPPLSLPPLRPPSPAAATSPASRSSPRRPATKSAPAPPSVERSAPSPAPPTEGARTSRAQFPPLAPQARRPPRPLIAERRSPKASGNSPPPRPSAKSAAPAPLMTASSGSTATPPSPGCPPAGAPPAHLTNATAAAFVPAILTAQLSCVIARQQQTTKCCTAPKSRLFATNAAPLALITTNSRSLRLALPDSATFSSQAGAFDRTHEHVSQITNFVCCSQARQHGSHFLSHFELSLHFQEFHPTYADLVRFH